MELVNAIERSEHSESFDVLERDKRAKIPVGGFAKVCCAGERFWVEVTGNNNGEYTGRVANDLLMSHVHGLSNGDPISFDARHVFDVA